MKKKLAIAQPAVIDTEITPLTDSFRIEPNGQTEQWYYENSGAFAPDRRIIPLTLTSVIKALDTNTGTVYTPTFYLLKWYAREWNGSAWVRTEITNTTDSTSQPYVKVTATNSLKIHKNVENAAYPVTIECEGEYTDPRDAGTTIKVADSVVLTVNQEATVQYPQLDVLNESTRSYNPLRDTSSQYEFNAKADWQGLNEGNGSLAFKADNLGTEEITTAKTDAPASVAPVLDVVYDKGIGSIEQTDQKFTYRKTGGGGLSAIGSGTGKVEKLKGNTAVWNQLSSINTFSNTITDTKGYFQLQVVSYLNNSVGAGYSGVDFTSPLLYGKVVTIYDNTNRIRVKHNGSARDIDVMWIENVIPTHKVLITFYVKSVNPSSVGGLVINNIGVYDLTLMFGAGNEPTTVAAFDQWLDANVGLKGYYPYDAGSLIPVKDTTLKTVGFNLWDGVFESGYYDSNTGNPVSGSGWLRSKNGVKVLPQTAYYLGGTYRPVRLFYDKSGNYLGCVDSSNREFTTPANCYLLQFYNNHPFDDLCINLSDASKNGTYEAYWENKLNMPVTTLQGRVLTNGVAGGSPVVMFPDGLKSIGNVCDEINLKTLRAVKRVGKYDLGNAFWTFAQGSTNVFFEQAVKGNKFVCDKYSFVDKNAVVDNASAESNLGNMEFTYRHGSTQDRLYFKNTGYTDAEAFKTAMSGVYLYYELATPVEYEFDPIPQGQFEWYGVSNGTEVKIDTLPAYVSGQNTDTLRIDALYSELITVVCRYRKYPWDEDLIPQKVYRAVAWRVPELDVIVVCNRGNSIRYGDAGDYVFSTIVNMGSETLSEEIKTANLEFKWFSRKSNSAAAPTLLDWGNTIAVAASNLINSRVNGTVPSSMIFCEVYIKGALVAVTSNGVTTYQRQSNQQQ